MTTAFSKIQTVSELTASIRGILETGFSFVAVSGEVSNLRRPLSGHMYFTLKDQQAQLKAVLFKMQQRYLRLPIQEGKQLTCYGRISLYEPRGEYQLVVDRVELVGKGDLHAAFEALKEKLAVEGLFDAERKQNLPHPPKKIALVTSPSGAAVHDFLKVARIRFPLTPIEVFPVSVQGDLAVREIMTSLNVIAERGENDVIVLCRGGGSLEDLWPFNDEQLARSIAACRVPIVSAVGHEIDFTIADLVADKRAATPTEAAEILLPSAQEYRRQITHLKQTLIHQNKVLFSSYRERLQTVGRSLGDPTSILDRFRFQVDRLLDHCERGIADKLQLLNQKSRHCHYLLQKNSPSLHLQHLHERLAIADYKMKTGFQSLVEEKQNALRKNAAILNAVSPLAVLARGYAIVRRKGDNTPVKDALQLNPGESVKIRFHNGKAECRVEKTEQRD